MAKSRQSSDFILWLSLSLLIVLIVPNLQPGKIVKNRESIEVDIIKSQDIAVSLLEEEPVEQIELILGGDVMLGRNVMITAIEASDWEYPFRNIADELRRADIAFINLEAPFVTDCPRIESGYIFCADPKLVAGLVHAGVDVVTLANNHTKNFGLEGLNKTVETLNEAGIDSAGVGELVVKSVSETTFGFLGFDYTVVTPSSGDYQLVLNSDSKVDVLIVGVHWGTEYTRYPTNNQKTWAKVMVENGADVIAGHHPHWVQDIDYIDSIPIYYSLGNLIFDQMWSEETKKGLVVRLTFEEGEIVNEERLPTYIASWALPEFVEYTNSK